MRPGALSPEAARFEALSIAWAPYVAWYANADPLCPCKTKVEPFLRDWLGYVDDWNAGAVPEGDVMRDLAHQAEGLKSAIRLVQRFSSDDPEPGVDRPALSEASLAPLRDAVREAGGEARALWDRCGIGDVECLRAGSSSAHPIAISQAGGELRYLAHVLGPSATGWTPGWRVEKTDEVRVDGRPLLRVDLQTEGGERLSFWFVVSASSGSRSSAASSAASAPAMATAYGIPATMGAALRASATGAPRATDAPLGRARGLSTGYGGGTRAPYFTDPDPVTGLVDPFGDLELDELDEFDPALGAPAAASSAAAGSSASSGASPVAWVGDLFGRVAGLGTQAAQTFGGAAAQELGGTVTQLGEQAGGAAARAATTHVREQLPGLAHEAAQALGQAAGPLVDPIAERAGQTAGAAAGRAAAAEVPASQIKPVHVVAGLAGAGLAVGLMMALASRASRAPG